MAQVVLTGGNRNVQRLNAVAGDKGRSRSASKRSVVDYCLGTLGEDQRKRDQARTYICLGFADSEGQREPVTIGMAIEARRFPGANYQVPRDTRRVAFDAVALGDRLTVRARRRGDRFTPFGASHERRLKTFLIDAKLPRWGRSRLPVVESAGTIVWLAGLRRSALAPVHGGTREVVELVLLPARSDVIE
jgi:tRNA(Ile)-lysidine synthetase-like protein